jgi:hypothetical protein
MRTATSLAPKRQLEKFVARRRWVESRGGGWLVACWTIVRAFRASLGQILAMS